MAKLNQRIWNLMTFCHAHFNWLKGDLTGKTALVVESLKIALKCACVMESL